jgi:hypothetical protein
MSSQIPLILATFAGGSILVAFFMLLAGIRSEERNFSLKDEQTTPINAATRKFLGVYVRTPDQSSGRSAKNR